MMTLDKVYFEAVLRSESGHSIFNSDTPALASTLEYFRPEPGRAQLAAQELVRLGFTVRHTGTFSISAEGPKHLFEQVFSTQLDKRYTSSSSHPQAKQVAYWFHMANTPFILPESLQHLLDRVYPQRPAQMLGMCSPSPLPPPVLYPHLRLPDDVATILRTHQSHRQGITGKNILVAMPDTGFFQHPFYLSHGYRYHRTLIPGSITLDKDEIGHGTAIAANVFACAPDANFIGLKMGFWDMALALKTAAELRPQIITCSWGWGHDASQEEYLPNYLKPLEIAILEAVYSFNITVCCAAGNGGIASFPSIMPDVISVGGVYAHTEFDGKDFKLQASNYATAAISKIYPGRRIPDVCGLVGQGPRGMYIASPVEPGDDIDDMLAQPEGHLSTKFPNADETQPNDGWAVLSGTSSAAPQIAGICALLKQINPQLSPDLIKNILKASCRDVIKGQSSNIKIDDASLPAGPGYDEATGTGLVDAALACDLARSIRNAD